MDFSCLTAKGNGDKCDMRTHPPACKNSHASICEQGVKKKKGKNAGDAVCSLPWSGLYLFILTR